MKNIFANFALFHRQRDHHKFLFVYRTTNRILCLHRSTHSSITRSLGRFFKPWTHHWQIGWIYIILCFTRMISVHIAGTVSVQDVPDYTGFGMYREAAINNTQSQFIHPQVPSIGHQLYRNFIIAMTEIWQGYTMKWLELGFRLSCETVLHFLRVWNQRVRNI